MNKSDKATLEKRSPIVAFLFLYWRIGLPLGIQGGYEYAIPAAPVGG